MSTLNRTLWSYALGVVAAEYVAVRVWLARAYFPAGGGLAFRPAARAARKQERRFRVAKTEWLCW